MNTQFMIVLLVAVLFAIAAPVVIRLAERGERHA